MRYFCRGISYRASVPAIAPTETEPENLMPGSRFKVQQAAVGQRSGIVLNLKYRGVDANP